MSEGKPWVERFQPSGSKGSRDNFAIIAGGVIGLHQQVRSFESPIQRKANTGAKARSFVHVDDIC